MKDYQRKAIESLPREDRIEALRLLALSTPDILDYLIASHKEAIKQGTGPYIPQSTIVTWKNTVSLLESARALYGRKVF